ncbi:MAG TPA: YiiX family permuted papain-like enzyme [Holophagaceae bacterium]|nr:YiiX family permuted papain-like enzyme [Holophagaceae bacterium]
MRGIFGVLLATRALVGGEPWREGDVLFQTSRSNQSVAVQSATHSKWSHMRLLFRRHGRWVVLEAVQPVKYTVLDAWIRRGEGGHVEAKRLKASVKRLSSPEVAKLQREGERFLGRPYDLTFEWDDRRIYCSELVWKAYDRALGLKLGKLQTLAEFDLTAPAVQRKMAERYPKGMPRGMSVISPQAMYDAPELETAWSR